MFMSLRTQYENLGDLMINRAALELMLETGAVVGSSSKVPDWYRDRLLAGLKNVSVTGRSLPSLVGASKIVVLKPGGYPGIRSARAALLWAVHTLYLFALKALGFHVVRLPSSHALSRRRYRWIDKARALAPRTLLIRDAESNETLLNLGARTTLCPDLAVHFFDVHSPYSTPTAAIDDSAKTELTFSFRGDRRPVDLGVLEETRRYLGVSSRVKVASQVWFDHAHNALLADSAGAEFVAYDGSETSLMKIKETYLGSNWVVSDRLHVLLMGALNGAIPVALIDPKRDQKVSGCLAQLGIYNVATYDERGAIFWPPELQGIAAIRAALLKSKAALSGVLAEALHD
ncbi:polysaccharide pyruvyl transferase family protein [Noviluteimonas dokdonensis]|uniref:polysaccharide pyruvyl transferase family protein n=1 Tax=Noviluteimonas dokdonensis TaxID=414050 RepID=UPI000566A23F|nr:polysaccharide pyruvyl transferase family protein [Lysobacter dokdonensis]